MIETNYANVANKLSLKLAEALLQNALYEDAVEQLHAAQTASEDTLPQEEEGVDDVSEV